MLESVEQLESLEQFKAILEGVVDGVAESVVMLVSVKNDQ
jgi:hypothetical protein